MVLSKLDSEEFGANFRTLERTTKLRSNAKVKEKEQYRNYDDDSYQEKYTVVFRQVWWLETYSFDGQEARHLQTYKYKIGARNLSSRDAAMDMVKGIPCHLSVHQTSESAARVDLRSSTFCPVNIPHLNIQQSIAHRSNICAPPVRKRGLVAVDRK